jgi:hypothetical protein
MTSIGTLLVYNNFSVTVYGALVYLAQGTPSFFALVWLVGPLNSWTPGLTLSLSVGLQKRYYILELLLLC